MPRPVFFLSDRTGITARNLGLSLLTQFPDLEFAYTSLPFVGDQRKAREAAERIRQAGVDSSLNPLVFSSFVDPALQATVATSGAQVIDIYGAFLPLLETMLGAPAARLSGRMHGMGDLDNYQRRMDAVNFTLNHDDGIKTNDLDRADLVLVGVSRCGKTPTCLYLAMQYNLHAANYPLTDDDLERSGLPAILDACRDRLYGLSITPERLNRIREQRRPNSRYASLAQCRHEIERAEAMFREAGIPYLHTTAVSVEEIATTIRQELGL